jgi:crotonobetainyl-CoA:carnitine CoA-transferase CaiB-like acyl-CoA transferase
MASRSLEEWLAIFAEVDVCVEPVLTTSEMIDHPQTQARRLIVEVPGADGAGQRQVASPFKFSATPPVYRHTGPALGQHTRDILEELGYREAEINQFQTAGLFG